MLGALLTTGAYASLVFADWLFPTLPEPPVTTQVSEAKLISVYCSGCHTSGRAHVDLDQPVNDRSVRQDPETWKKVLEQLRHHRMPPPAWPQPQTEERARVIAWVEQALARQETEAYQNAPFMGRRLRRREYLNTIRDLVDVAFELPPDFPADDPGWDRYEQLPNVPPALQERYASAAQRILDQMPEVLPPAQSASNQLERGRELIATMGRRAYRRPLEANEIDDLVADFRRALETGSRFADALKLALRSILTSAHFLYLSEARFDSADVDADCKRWQLELASRLSYWLWGSMPDDELLTLAQQQRLLEHLDHQVRRLLKDPRAARFAADFADFWLGLDRLQRFRGHNPTLIDDMLEETHRFVGGIVGDNRSVLEFLRADYTFANQRLAQHYGISGVYGNAWQRVCLAGTERGGLLTHASILTLTSSSGRTSPVNRGKWALENLLGIHQAPPPTGLLEAFSQRRLKGPGTKRQLLEQHSADPSCAQCHGPLDAIGLALENFDQLGAWRTHDERQLIDARVVMPSGELVRGPTELRDFIAAKEDQFVQCLSDKLLAYALGRKLEGRDRAEMDRVAASVPEHELRFADLVAGIASSGAFQTGWKAVASRPVRARSDNLGQDADLVRRSPFDPPSTNSSLSEASRVAESAVRLEQLRLALACQ